MLPPDRSLTLAHYFGNYVIELRCRKCRHSRELDARSLARIAGRDAELASLATRFRCSQCQARSVELSVGFGRRPRGWNKNPS